MYEIDDGNGGVYQFPLPNVTDTGFTTSRGIRYSEALAFECTYQRWLDEKREQRIAALEAKLEEIK